MSYPQERIILERRLQRDRRRGIDRRIGRRRFQALPPPVGLERRKGEERRVGPRRSPFGRRTGKERRISGPTVSRSAP